MDIKQVLEKVINDAPEGKYPKQTFEQGVKELAEFLLNEIEKQHS